VTSPTQKPLPNNIQHSQETHIHSPGGAQTRNPSKRVAADPRLRPISLRCKPQPFTLHASLFIIHSDAMIRRRVITTLKGIIRQY